MQQINNNITNPAQCFIPPYPKKEKIKKEQNIFLGKKINNDADLISWLSGKEINQKTSEEKLVPYELNFKVKKKMRNKLIKNAKKCELYFVQHSQNKEYINIKCIYCLKDIFNHNELLKFSNFEEFIYYLKYIFYLSDKVFAYSLTNFKNNKKESDILISKFESKEENWIFNFDIHICKLCIFKLINKPNFIENIKEIFLEGKNEMGIINDNIIVEIKNEEEYEENKNKNKINKDKINIPNYINNNNVNININNANIINNNFNNYNNATDSLIFQSFYNSYEKIKNNSIEIINKEELNIFLNKLFYIFYINHNRIIDEYWQIKFEMEKMLYYLSNKNIIIENQNQNEKNIIMQQISYIIILLNNFFELINITNECLIKYQNICPNIFINSKNILQNIINQNNYNHQMAGTILAYLKEVIKLYMPLI